MAKQFISFAGDVSAFKKFTNPAVWKGQLEDNIKKATIANSLFLIREIKKNIKDRKFEENAPLTLALKRSDLPLLNDRNLWNAIDHKLKSSFESEVGIVAKKKSTGGVTGKTTTIKKVIELMENGYTITVTNKMRIALAAALKKKTKKGQLTKKSREARAGFSSGSGSNTFRVPSRPVFSKVFEDPAVDRFLKRNWNMALETTFKFAGAKDGDWRNR